MRSWSFLSLLLLGTLTGCSGHVVIDTGDDGDASPNTSTGQGGDAGAQATIIAAGIQLTPTNLVSDGTSLFWVSGEDVGGPLSSMPTGGGTITEIVSGPIPEGLLAVDDTNVYYQVGNGIYRAPKAGGGSPTLVNENTDGGGEVLAVTALGSSVHWLERTSAPSGTPELLVESALLKGGSTSALAAFIDAPAQRYSTIGVTVSTVFVSGPTLTQVTSSPLSGAFVDGGTLMTDPGALPCAAMVSDTDAVYCQTVNSIVSLASDGTITSLGPFEIEGLVGGSIGFDDTYVYWVNNTIAGTVMKAPKAGGVATVIAHDNAPVAIAVDVNAVYWSDVAGNIMRLAK